jgi:predicted Zn finger-like uncharacterized protein
LGKIAIYGWTLPQKGGNMIILCEKCQTKFRINEDLLSDDGSRVRCSLCKHVFMAYPSQQDEIPDQKPQTELEQWPEVREETYDSETEEAVGSDAVSIEDSMEDIRDLEREYENGHKGFGEKTADMTPAVNGDEIEKKAESVEAAEIMAPVSAKKGPGRSFTPLILLSAIILFIGAGGYVYMYAPHLIPDFLHGPIKSDEVKKGPDSGASRLEIVTVEGSFLNSERAGSLFVIRGKVTNNYPEVRSFILVKGSILDDKGQVVKERSAYAGNTFSDEELVVLPVEKISKAMNNPQGINDNNLNIGSGESLNFIIVFEKLPENISEFTVGAVSSSPGSPRPAG